MAVGRYGTGQLNGKRLVFRLVSVSASKVQFFIYSKCVQRRNVQKMKFEINPAYPSLNTFIKSIPDIFGSEGDTIYKGRNELKVYQVDGVMLLVKYFKIPNLINRFVYAHLRHSKARRSYVHAFQLLNANINTPMPIAYIEESKYGLLSRSYYVSIYETKAGHIRGYMAGIIKDERLLGELASFIASFHNLGIYHLDLTPGNVLFKATNSGYEFMLVDINRMKFKSRLSIKERYKSLAKLSNHAEVSRQLTSEYSKHCKVTV